MTSVYNYRLFCCTENQFVFSWGQTTPTTCPNNNQHTIDSTSVVIVDSKDSNNVTIVQVQPGATGDNYRVEGQMINIAANSSTTKDMSWPYNVAIMTINFSIGTQHSGDIIMGMSLLIKQ